MDPGYVRLSLNYGTPVTRIAMSDGREYKAIGHPSVIGYLLKAAREGGWPFIWRDPQGRKYEIPAKEITSGKCTPDGTTRR